MKTVYTLADIIHVDSEDLQKLAKLHNNWLDEFQNPDRKHMSCGDKYLFLVKYEEEVLNKLPKLSTITIDSIQNYKEFDFVKYGFKDDYSGICIKYRPKNVNVSFWIVPLQDVKIK